VDGTLWWLLVCALRNPGSTPDSAIGFPIEQDLKLISLPSRRAFSIGILILFSLFLIQELFKYFISSGTISSDLICTKGKRCYRLIAGLLCWEEGRLQYKISTM